MGFQKYMEDVRSQLECNCTDENRDYTVFTFTPEQVNKEMIYFFRCFGRNLSAYKALTFFSDHLKSYEIS